MTISKRLKLTALALVIGFGGLELGTQMLFPGNHGFVSSAVQRLHVNSFRSNLFREMKLAHAGVYC